MEPIQDTDVEDHPPKRTKTKGHRYGNQPLRRTGMVVNPFLLCELTATYLRNNPIGVDVDRR